MKIVVLISTFKSNYRVVYLGLLAADLHIRKLKITIIKHELYTNGNCFHYLSIYFKQTHLFTFVVSG